jgi:RNase H-like domain found in reverse transcriptase
MSWRYFAKNMAIWWMSMIPIVLASIFNKFITFLELYKKNCLIIYIYSKYTEWRHFIEGAEHQVEIWMNYKNLEYFMTPKKLNRRQARWSLILARFDFLMHHQPGKTMGKSNTLIQRSDHSSGAKDNDNMVLLTLNFLTVQTLEGLVMLGEEGDIPKEIQ